MMYGCIGEHLSHSFSREIHTRLTDKYDYILKEIPRGELDAFMKSGSFQAINVTIPYKQDVIPYLDVISPEAQRIGAVNTIVRRQGKLYGYNTDFLGMCGLLKRAKIELKSKKVLILGSGGTSKTAFAVATHLGASEVLVVSRHPDGKQIDYEAAVRDHADAQVIINTTPVGMYPKNEGCPIDIELFPDLGGVIDAIYNPHRTNLITQAQKRGIAAEGGLYMLVAQAAYAAEKFLGTSIPESEFERVYSAVRRQKANVVLIGMPGCGKTTVGRALAQKEGRAFIDTDEEITRKTGRTPDEIIRQDGVEVFRDIESRVIEEISSSNSAVISVGGGGILRERNAELLRMNGILVFLDCPIDLLTVSDDRPLSSTREALEQRYRERLPIYRRHADFTVESDKNLENNLKKIERELEKI